MSDGMSESRSMMAWLIARDMSIPRMIMSVSISNGMRSVRRLRGGLRRRNGHGMELRRGNT
jgi:hypothetical protein